MRAARRGDRRRLRSSAGRSSSASRAATINGCSTPCSSALRGFLEDNRTTFRERLEQESPWWVPEPIDDRIFNKIFAGVAALPATTSPTTPTTSCGARSTSALAAFAERLQQRPGAARQRARS